MGCGTLSQPIAETDKALEQRLTQAEDAMKHLKSEAIAEARDAAAALVTDATAKLEEAGKGVITHAANELDSRVEKRLAQIDGILEKRIDQSVAKIDNVISKHQDDASDTVRTLMRDEVPKMVADSVSKSADTLAERFGAVKKTEIGPDGVPVEVWALGGSGLLAGILNFVRVWVNGRSGKKRYSEEEFEENVQAILAKRGSNGTTSLSGSTAPASTGFSSSSTIL